MIRATAHRATASRSWLGISLIVCRKDSDTPQSRPHGHVAAVHALARRLGFPELLGEPSRMRDVAFADYQALPAQRRQ